MLVLKFLLLAILIVYSIIPNKLLSKIHKKSLIKFINLFHTSFILLTKCNRKTEKLKNKGKKRSTESWLIIKTTRFKNSFKSTSLKDY